MATLKTTFALTRLGYTSVPEVVKVTQCREINSAVRKLLDKEENEPNECFVHSPCEIVRSIWWWLTNPFSEAQLQALLDSESTFAEDYVEAGSLAEGSGNLVALRRHEAEAGRTDEMKFVPFPPPEQSGCCNHKKPPKKDNKRQKESKPTPCATCKTAPDSKGEASQSAPVVEPDAPAGKLVVVPPSKQDYGNPKRADKNGGMTVLINEPLEVKEHRRVHTRHREQYAAALLATIKLKFGVPRRTEANRQAIHRYAAELMRGHGLRPTDAARVLPYVVHAAFIPNDDEINAARWLETELAKTRMSGWKFMGQT